MFLKLIGKQGTVEQHLHQMALLWGGGVWWKSGFGVWHKSSLARLLLNDQHFSCLFGEEVQSSLYAKNITEEGRFEQHFLCIIVFHVFGQVVKQELFDVFLLVFCILVKLVHCRFAFLSAQHQQLQGMFLEELGHSFVEGDVTVVNNIVKILACQITQLYCQGVGWGFQLVDKCHEGRLGIAFKARGYSGDVDEIVGLKDDELRHAHIFFPTQTHEVECCSFPHYL